jgi:hypothetical protein
MRQVKRHGRSCGNFSCSLFQFRDPLQETAEYFGTKGFLTVSWNCRVVESKIAREMKFKDRIEKTALLELTPKL